MSDQKRRSYLESLKGCTIKYNKQVYTVRTYEIKAGGLIHFYADPKNFDIPNSWLDKNDIEIVDKPKPAGELMAFDQKNLPNFIDERYKFSDVREALVRTITKLEGIDGDKYVKQANAISIAAGKMTEMAKTEIMAIKTAVSVRGH